MKKLLLLSILALSFASHGQSDTTTVDMQLLHTDSLVEKTKRLKDSISLMKPDDTYFDIDRNMRYIQEIQKKNEAKKRRNAIVRISIGIALLVLLVIGWRRKVKK